MSSFALDNSRFRSANQTRNGTATTVKFVTTQVTHTVVEDEHEALPIPTRTRTARFTRLAHSHSTRQVVTITGFKNSVIGVSASPSNGTFATGSGDNLVCVWNYGDRPVGPAGGVSDGVTAAAAINSASSRSPSAEKLSQPSSSSPREGRREDDGGHSSFGRASPGKGGGGGGGSGGRGDADSHKSRGGGGGGVAQKGDGSGGAAVTNGKERGSPPSSSPPPSDRDRKLPGSGGGGKR